MRHVAEFRAELGAPVAVVHLVSAVGPRDHGLAAFAAQHAAAEQVQADRWPAAALARPRLEQVLHALPGVLVDQWGVLAGEDLIVVADSTRVDGIAQDPTDGRLAPGAA